MEDFDFMNELYEIVELSFGVPVTLEKIEMDAVTYDKFSRDLKEGKVSKYFSGYPGGIKLECNNELKDIIRMYYSNGTVRLAAYRGNEIVFITAR